MNCALLLLKDLEHNISMVLSKAQVSEETKSYVMFFLPPCITVITFLGNIYHLYTTSPTLLLTISLFYSQVWEEIWTTLNGHD